MGTFKGIPLWILPLFLGQLNAQLYIEEIEGSSSGEYLIHETIQNHTLSFIPAVYPTPVVKAINKAHNNKVCSTWGNFNFKNFDGDVFRFPGTCNYVFSSHCKSDYEDFNIQIQRSITSSILVISKITMKINGLVVQVIENNVLVDGKVVQLPYSGLGVQIEKRDVSLKVSSKLGLVLMLNDDNSLMLELDEKYANQTCGLCGDYNGISIHNEFINHGVHITETQFGNLQKLDGPTEQCQDVKPEPRRNCTRFENICENILMGSAFLNCHSLVDVEQYMEACVQDLCHCNSKMTSLCMCNTFAEYSRQCAHAGGQPRNWRTKEFCSARKCPLNMEYRECGSACPNTCTNPERAALCDSHCLEGCYCPKGTVFDDINNKGCIPVDMCPCITAGEIYSSGESYSTPCSTCVCFSGKWSCKELPCSSTCSVEGGSHITTYDQTHYNIHGDCNYVLTKMCKSNEFTVLAELRKCGLSESETCLKSIMILLNGEETTVMIKPCGSVYVNTIFTQLPVSTASVTIFKPTSFYIIVQTNMGLQVVVQLTPFMQVYVVLHPALQTKTCGLCGNFNNIQTDDFMTINGILEGTAASFANSWKTQADCPNIKNDYNDPCSLSLENEQYASFWCGLISDPNGPFAACHSQVNPKRYQKNCMFDSCSCEKSEDCMCASLSSYSRVCLSKGVILPEWQGNTPCSKYTKYCPESLNYTYSMSTCQPTCRSRFEPDITCSIKFTPVDGCSCTKGFYMDDSGKCVPGAACPCYYKGSAVPSGEVVHDNKIQCSCTEGVLSCIGINKPECTAPMVYFDCNNATEFTKGAECQKSCQILGTQCYRTNCVSGCVCPDGLLSDGKGGCINEEQCPCEHNGASYQPGEKIKVKCNTCTCKNRLWQCTDKPCLGTCAVYGDGHYITFDGKQYTFNGKCEYSLLQDLCGKTEGGSSFRVITENIPCGTTGTTCSQAIKVYLGNFELSLTNEKFDIVKRDPNSKVPYTVRYMGIYLVIESDSGLILLWDKKTSIFIKLTRDFKGDVCGLCGNYDGDGNNDFTTRSLSLIGDPVEFGNSWKHDPTCPDASPTRDPCSANPYRKSWAQKQCSIIKSKTFSDCHSQLDPSPYYDACVSDSCACDSGGDCECMCTAIAAYALACSEAGICVSWRTPSICPIFCDYYNPEGECEWHYKPCEHSCLKTCRNPTGKCLYDLPGLEGCYPNCPAEKPVFDEDTMACVAQCGCYDDEGNHYPPRTPLPRKKNCHTCVCSMSSIIECKYDKSACYCMYNGIKYNYNDVIYYTRDNTGACRSAICKENGTILRDTMCPPTTPTTTFVFTTTPITTVTTTPTTSTSTICVQKYCEWSDWIDTSYPASERDSGDFETYDNIRAKGLTICNYPEEIKCRAKRFPEISLNELEQNVHCNASFGLKCYNRDQLPPICYNYEISVKCCEIRGCDFISTATTTTTPTTTETTTPTTETTTEITTPTTTETTTETTTSTTESTTETTSPTTTTETTTTTESTTPTTTSTTEITTETTSPTTTETTTTETTTPTTTETTTETTTPTTETTTETTTSTTETTTETTTPTTTETTTLTTTETITTTETPTATHCEPMCKWTNWIDAHAPGLGKGEGDFETYEKISAAGINVCKEPADIQCRAEKFPEKTIHNIDQAVQCNVTTGLVCKNEEQKGDFKECLNYQVKLLCCDDYSHCSTITTTPISTSTTTTSPTTHTVTTTICEQKCEWSPWFDKSYPESKYDGGEFETYENLRAKGYSICKNSEEIECRAKKYTDVPLEELGQDIQCNVSFGLICHNKNQEPPICLNYEIRVKCCDMQCPSTTTPSSSTSIITSTTTKTTTPSSTTHCFCYVDHVFYAPGDLIYKKEDHAGCSFYAVCNDLCEAEIFQGPCSTTPTTTTPTTTTTTTPTTTTPTTTITTTPTTTTPTITITTTPTSSTTNTIAYGCLPDKQPNESWKIGNCTTAKCLGNNVITYDSVKCPEVKELTCANGFQPIKVYSEDGCCFHYDCQCVCSGWGDPHYVTFDGIYYTFLDNCTYVLVQQITPKYDNFQVLVDNYFCDASDGLSCPQSIIIYYKSNEVLLTRQMFAGKMKNMIRFNKVWTTPGFTTDGIAVTSVGIKMIVEIPEIGAYISFSGLIFLIKLPYSKFGDNTEGQCGTCSNNQRDECRLPGGKIVQDCSQMADEWKVNVTEKPYCNLPKPTPKPTPVPPTCPPSPLCDVILSDVFAECHKIIPPKPYYDGCVFDACRVKNTTVECASFEVYASLCTSSGVCIDWRNRTNGHCPYKCPAEKVYNACGPVYPPTCDQRDVNKGGNYLTEGCYCPNGTVLFNSFSGICVPDCNVCQGPSGKPVNVGDSWISDCNNCTCKENPLSVKCEQLPCSKPEIQTCEQVGFVLEESLVNPCCKENKCVCKPNTCPAIVISCPLGFKGNPVVLEGHCCPSYNCTPNNVCVVGNQEYKPGDLITGTKDSCDNCECTEEKDTSTSLNKVKCKPIQCNEVCNKGYEYIKADEECCGSCVHTECIIITSNNSTITLKPGDTYTPEEDKCITYICKPKFEVEYQTEKCAIAEPSECLPGYKYQTLPGKCCGECIKYLCVMTLPDNSTKIMKPEDSYTPEEDKCITYICKPNFEVESQTEKCAITESSQCLPGYEYQKLPGKCCGECIKRSCVMTLPDNSTKIMKPEDKYTPEADKCIAYTCKSNFEVESQTEKCAIAEPSQCLPGYQYQKLPGKCCGECIKYVCVMTLPDNSTKIMKPGDTYTPEKNKCITYTCKSNFEVESQTEKCAISEPSQCLTGYQYQKLPGKCCGECIKYVCVMTLPDNSTKIMEPGDAYTPEENKCITYTCKSNFEVESQTVECAIAEPSQCLTGYQYQKLPGKCCGECIKYLCVMTLPDNSTKIMEPGNTYIPEDDKCIKYTCTSNYDIVTIKESCPPFDEQDCKKKHGIITMSKNGCCKLCMEQQVGCLVLKEQQNITNGTCKSEQTVELSYCEGSCSTKSMYSADSNSMEHKCSCCQELKTSQRQVDLQCEDGSSSVFSYIYVEECGCTSTECQTMT